MKTTNSILIIDLEATCWDKQELLPNEQISEIIEIGICILDITSGAITSNKGILIRPEQSEISSFCTALTSIDQALLDDEGTTFNNACEQLRKEYQAHLYTWASYGAYDLNMMKAQCRSRNIPWPLSDDHINVKEVFAEKHNHKKRTGMSSALKILDIPLEGTHHRGVDDARNIAKILYRCL